MALPKLTRLEFRIMEALWARGACSIREIQEAFPAKGRPAFTTIQTTVNRMEEKKAVRNTKRVGKANIFEAVISRDDAQHRLIDELLSLIGGEGKPVMAHLVQSGRLTMADIKEAEEELRKTERKEKSK